MQDFEVKERLREHLEYLCSFDKLSGEPEGVSARSSIFLRYWRNPGSPAMRRIFRLI